MNSFEQSWNRLIAAARYRAERDAAPTAPSAAWVTRVAALGASAACSAGERVGSLLRSWAVPSFGVALLVAVLTAVALRPAVEPVSETDALVALADPLADGSLFP